MHVATDVSKYKNSYKYAIVEYYGKLVTLREFNMTSKKVSFRYMHQVEINLILYLNPCQYH